MFPNSHTIVFPSNPSFSVAQYFPSQVMVIVEYQESIKFRNCKIFPMEILGIMAVLGENPEKRKAYLYNEMSFLILISKLISITEIYYSLMVSTSFSFSSYNKYL